MTLPHDLYSLSTNCGTIDNDFRIAMAQGFNLRIAMAQGINSTHRAAWFLEESMTQYGWARLIKYREY